MPETVLHLGNKNYSSWSLRGWLAVKLAGIPFREERHDIDDTVRPELRRVSPAGKVPALEHEGVVIWDSLAIGEYLAERFPEARLWPDDRAARAFARSACAEMHSGFMALRSSCSMNLRARRGGHSGGAAVQKDVDRITQLWRDCRSRFGADGAFLFGRPTLADAFYAPVVTRFRTYGIEVDPISRAFCETVWAWEPMKEWAADAETEPALASHD